MGRAWGAGVVTGRMNDIQERGYVGRVAREITFDAQRDPMFQDEDGRGWVPLARFHEVYDENARLLDRVATLETALRLQEDWHTFPDGRFCSDDCPKCARDAALGSVPVSETAKEETT